MKVHSKFGSQGNVGNRLVQECTLQHVLDVTSNAIQPCVLLVHISRSISQQEQTAGKTASARSAQSDKTHIIGHILVLAAKN